MAVLIDRGIIKDGRLTPYGREVEAMPVERPWGELLVRADPELVPLVATAANIDSLHRMTREERELHGLIANGSDHLTAANVYAEAVNQHGYLGEVYGLPRHLFEDGLTEWAEKRGVLVKSVEDTALGVAAVYRALELPLPKTMPYASKELRNRFIELVARVMPFDLVIDEHTLDGTEARISKTSMAGSWGAVAGTLRFFGDRNGIARAGIEGTTIPYDLVRQNARKGPPVVSVAGPRKHRHLAVSRRLTYFGFELETVVEELRGEVPAALQEPARDALADALLEGDTPHPDQGRIKRALGELGELWRRSGGTLEAIATPVLRARIRGAPRGRHQLAGVPGHASATRRRLPGGRRHAGAAPRAAVDGASPRRRRAARLRGRGGRGGGGAALREGQLRRTQEADLPRVDRPLRFSVLRGAKPALHGKTLDALREAIRTEPRERKGRHTEFRGPRQPGGRAVGAGVGVRAAAAGSAADSQDSRASQRRWYASRTRVARCAAREGQLESVERRGHEPRVARVRVQGSSRTRATAVPKAARSSGLSAGDSMPGSASSAAHAAQPPLPTSSSSAIQRRSSAAAPEPASASSRRACRSRSSRRATALRSAFLLPWW